MLFFTISFSICGVIIVQNLLWILKYTIDALFNVGCIPVCSVSALCLQMFCKQHIISGLH